MTGILIRLGPTDTEKTMLTYAGMDGQHASEAANSANNLILDFQTPEL